MKKHILWGQVGYISIDPELAETKVVVVKEAISRESIRRSNKSKEEDVSQEIAPYQREIAIICHSEHSMAGHSCEGLNWCYQGI